MVNNIKITENVTYNMLKNNDIINIIQVTIMTTAKEELMVSKILA